MKRTNNISVPEEEELSSKEKLMIIAKLIINTCSHTEIQILCTALLDADLKCRVANSREELS